MKTINEVRKGLEARKDRSAWDKGVTVYALELLDELEENREYNKADKYLHPLELKAELLNGADDWNAYSWGGCALIYDTDIAERLCTPSELKRKHNGELRPNSREEWLDVQTRALCQASKRIINVARF